MKRPDPPATGAPQKKQIRQSQSLSVAAIHSSLSQIGRIGARGQYRLRREGDHDQPILSFRTRRGSPLRVSVVGILAYTIQAGSLSNPLKALETTALR